MPKYFPNGYECFARPTSNDCSTQWTHYIVRPRISQLELQFKWNENCLLYTGKESFSKLKSIRAVMALPHRIESAWNAIHGQCPVIVHKKMLLLGIWKNPLQCLFWYWRFWKYLETQRRQFKVARLATTFSPVKAWHVTQDWCGNQDSDGSLQLQTPIHYKMSMEDEMNSRPFKTTRRSETGGVKLCRQTILQFSLCWNMMMLKFHQR